MLPDACSCSPLGKAQKLEPQNLAWRRSCQCCQTLVMLSPGSFRELVPQSDAWCGGAQAFCDEAGAPLSQEQAGRRLEKELELDRKMRMFFRHRFSQTCAPTRARRGSPGHMGMIALQSWPIA